MTKREQMTSSWKCKDFGLLSLVVEECALRYDIFNAKSYNYGNLPYVVNMGEDAHRVQA